MNERRRRESRFGSSITLPEWFQKGSQARRWFALSARSALTVADVGLLVAGTGLVSIGGALILNGFGVLNLAVPDDLGQALAVGLVVAMIGGFCIGIAVEGPIGYTAPAPTTRPWESLVVAIPAMFGFVWVIGLIERIADRFLHPYSELFSFVSAHFNAVQQAGITTGLIIGLPVMWGLQQFVTPRMAFLRGAAPGVLYIPWMIGVVAIYQPIL